LERGGLGFGGEGVGGWAAFSAGGDLGGLMAFVAGGGVRGFAFGGSVGSFGVVMAFGGGGRFAGAGWETK
jgi:hypothetical protein